MGWVVQSYDTPEGSARRAYVARGQKVYILDLMPDDPQQYALFTSVLQSFTFVEPMNRASRNHPSIVWQWIPRILAFDCWNGAWFRICCRRLNPSDRTSHCRLPFVGSYEIAQGPYTQAVVMQVRCIPAMTANLWTLVYNLTATVCLRARNNALQLVPRLR